MMSKLKFSRTRWFSGLSALGIIALFAACPLNCWDAYGYGAPEFAQGCCYPTIPEDKVEKCNRVGGNRKDYIAQHPEEGGWCEVKEWCCSGDVTENDQKECDKLAEKWAEEGKDICKDELPFESSGGEPTTGEPTTGEPTTGEPTSTTGESSGGASGTSSESGGSASGGASGGDTRTSK